jgi:hypothetical protein
LGLRAEHTIWFVWYDAFSSSAAVAGLLGDLALSPFGLAVVSALRHIFLALFTFWFFFFAFPFRSNFRFCAFCPAGVGVRLGIPFGVRRAHWFVLIRADAFFFVWLGALGGSATVARLLGDFARTTVGLAVFGASGHVSLALLALWVFIFAACLVG